MYKSRIDDVLVVFWMCVHMWGCGNRWGSLELRDGMLTRKAPKITNLGVQMGVVFFFQQSPDFIWIINKGFF